MKTRKQEAVAILSYVCGWTAALVAIVLVMPVYAKPRLGWQAEASADKCRTTTATVNAMAARAAAQEPSATANPAATAKASNPPTQSANAPLTRAQGVAILRELRAIRLLLQQGPRQVSVRRPRPILKVEMPVEPNWQTIGRADAPLIMVEFTDLQCPFCRRFETSAFPEIKKNYIDKGKVRLVALDLPLPMHPYALAAAEAEHCAGDQGKFWQFRDDVLDDQVPPTPDVLLKHAEELRLNAQEFQTCLKADKYKQAIQDDQGDAAAVGIHGTPAFVIGRVSGRMIQGVSIVGARPFSFFQRQIEMMLSKTQSVRHRPSRENQPSLSNP